MSKIQLSVDRKGHSYRKNWNKTCSKGLRGLLTYWRKNNESFMGYQHTSYYRDG